MKELELKSLSADRETLQLLLAEIADDDPIGRLSLSARLQAVEEEISALEATVSALGSVALLFSGGPVHGSRSIGANFAVSAIQCFQDLVTKQVASEEFGRLGARGRLPLRTPSELAIRELVRGSFGFVLEEASLNFEAVETPIRKAIDDVTGIIASIASESDGDFEKGIAELDPRIIISLRTFFTMLDENQATVRIVEGAKDEALDAEAIRRGRSRVDATEIEEQESEAIIGELLGLLPDARRFEMRLLDGGEIIKGVVAHALASHWLELIEKPDEKLIGEIWRSKMKIREIRERNRPPRKLYTLIGLVEKKS